MAWVRRWRTRVEETLQDRLGGFRGQVKTRRSFNAPRTPHALTFSCYQGRPLLGVDRTRRWLIDSISRARERHDFALWAYVIMPNHVHMLIYPRREVYTIAEILKAIKQPVGQRAMAHLREHAPERLADFAVRRPGGRVEHRFWQQGGGYDQNVDRTRTIQRTIDYIHMNPVRAALVQAPWDWYWSSARWYMGERDGPIDVDFIT